MTIAMIVSRPEVRRPVIYDEVSLTWMYLRSCRLMIRTYLNRLLRSSAVSGSRSDRRTVGGRIAGRTSGTGTGTCNGNRLVTIRTLIVLVSVVRLCS